MAHRHTISEVLGAAYGHLAAGRLAEADALCRQILARHKHEPEALHCLASVAFHRGQFDSAIELARAAIASAPTNVVFINDLGIMLRTRSNIDEAIAVFRQALRLEPAHPQVHYHLAMALREKRDLVGAAKSLQACIAAESDFEEAHFQLGNVLAEQGNAEAAAEQFFAATVIRPDHAGAFYNLGNAYGDQGKLEDAAKAYQSALAIDPGFSEAHSNLLWTMQYMDSGLPSDVFATALKYAETFEAPLRANWAPHLNSRDPGRRLKIGYVSADFRRHSVAYFVESLLKHHDSMEFEVYCYYNNSLVDEVTRRFISLADHWVPCDNLDDSMLDARIRQDGIDILIDLSGHTAHHRLRTFAGRPAPVQVTYLGYPATTGLSAINYRFTDAYADPPGAGDEYYTEQLIRLPQTFLSYSPPPSAPEVQSTPALRNGYVTFGSFNALQKISLQVVEVWSRLLAAMPTARLFLKSAGLEHEAIRERYFELFASHGVARDRVTLTGRDSNFNEHLQRYHEVDLALDPFPYNGTTTTFEAMWMGVPTVTLRGKRHAGRVGTSLLANAGLNGFIAKNEEEYVQIGLCIAGDLAQLDAIRRGLRQTLIKSPLMNPEELTRQIESSYRSMWKTWCEETSA